MLYVYKSLIFLCLIWSFRFLFLCRHFLVIFFNRFVFFKLLLCSLRLLFRFILLALWLNENRILRKIFETQRVLVWTDLCIEAESHVLLRIFLRVLLLPFQDNLSSSVLIPVIFPLLVIKLLRWSLFWSVGRWLFLKWLLVLIFLGCRFLFFKLIFFSGYLFFWCLLTQALLTFI